MSSADARKRALITGITGQDGSYLAELLLARGYDVYGTTRDPGLRLGPNLDHLDGKVRMIYTNYDLATVTDILRAIRPDEIYNFAGQTYVSKSWEMIEETFNASAQLPCTFLEAIVRHDRNIKFFQASSCEVYSMDVSARIDEGTPIAPGTPYGCSKALAQNMVAAYRHNYGLYALSGILFHHESPRRHENFVSQKVVKAAVAIKLGRQKELVLGNIDVERDWAFAPDVVQAIERMMHIDHPLDLAICSGQSHSLRQLVSEAFGAVDLDYRDYMRTDQTLFRPNEARVIAGSNAKARQMLVWAPQTTFKQMIGKMVDHEMRRRMGGDAGFANEKPFQ